MDRGVLAVISGFSGSGKGTLIRRLLELYDNYALSVSATSRKPREGEVEGVDYFYKTESEFLDMIRSDAFLEYAQYVEHYYGTPADFVEQQLSSGRDVLLEIEIQGALQIKKKRPDATLIFITPPSVAELERRLRGRGTESDSVINDRLSRARLEAEVMEDYDYLIINDEIDAAVEQIHAILQSQRRRVIYSREFIRELREDFKEREENRE